MNHLLAKIVREGAFASALIFIAAVIAIVVKNSSFNTAYDLILDYPLSLGFGSYALTESIKLWINDGLMVIFFIMVALEAKRELVEGRLSSWKSLPLPCLGAFGGVATPALIYSLINYHDSFFLRGWPIPTATDIAFALGVFSILGKRIPASLRVIFLAIVILDDLSAILFIGLFYTDYISIAMLTAAGITTVGLIYLNKLKVEALTPYIIGGFILWVFVLKSGIHATLAGVVLGFIIPIKSAHSSRSPLKILEVRLHPYVSFGILPIFAFANAGIELSSFNLENILHPVSLGVGTGLFFGKQLGIFGAIWGVSKAKLVEIPQNVTFPQIYGMALVAGMGFTMSLFMGSLSFGESGMQENVKIGVIMGSLSSAILGLLVLWQATKPVVKKDEPHV